MSQSSWSDPSPPSAASESAPTLPSDWLLGLAAVPFVAAMAGGRLVRDVALGLSQSSEEVFRGDRLPVLHFPQTPPDDSDAELSD
ncbi:MAG: hypothetical protein ACP5D7_21820 [Limnospira sp.]